MEQDEQAAEGDGCVCVCLIVARITYSQHEIMARAYSNDWTAVEPTNGTLSASMW